MDTTLKKPDFFKDNVLGHPAGLFVLFFTEMWERFSYYGMRGLFVLYLTAQVTKGGWGWDQSKAITLYGTYTMWIYITPIVGGFLADKFLGYRKAVLMGAAVMTLGHLSLALDGQSQNFFYLGLLLLIIGNGLFKPNVTSIISNIYEGHEHQKDSAYSIFYMGVNAGSFLGMMLCGYLGEKIDWAYGFGLAGVFMLLGLLQFFFTQKIFGNIGLTPSKKNVNTLKETKVEEVATPANVVRDRLIALLIFCICGMFFWAAFEQAGGSMTLFAEKNVQRKLIGNAAIIFKVIDTLLSIVPLFAITFVLGILIKKTFKLYPIGNSLLIFAFIIAWGLVIFKLNRTYSEASPEIPVTWFNILNPLFIIFLTPLFSKIWESKLNPSGPVKFALGLTFLGLGFGFLAYGAKGIIEGTDIKVNLMWLVLAYLFHTIGELCSSPVSLSYISKLVPVKWVGLVFGIYYVFTAFGNKIAGLTGSMIDELTAKYSLSTFFLIFTLIPIGLGLIMIILQPLIKKLMHGIK